MSWNCKHKVAGSAETCSPGTSNPGESYHDCLGPFNMPRDAVQGCATGHAQGTVFYCACFMETA